tara:strand:- start:1337 stop:1576 length:240 start_codon:yes stop_codon:yes gene_type:complete
MPSYVVGLSLMDGNHTYYGEVAITLFATSRLPDSTLDTLVKEAEEQALEAIPTDCVRYACFRPTLRGSASWPHTSNHHS